MKFRMVDRILDWQCRRSIRGVKNVSFEEYRLKAPFGDAPALPQSLLIEAMFQLGNWLIVLSSDFQRMGLLVRTQEIQFHDVLRPGERLLMTVEVRSYRDDGVLFDGRATAGERVVAVGTGCLATPLDLAGYFNPDDLRVLFDQIYQPEGETPAG